MSAGAQTPSAAAARSSSSSGRAAPAAASAKSAKSRTAAPTAATVRSGVATERVLRETFNQLSKGRSGHLPVNLIGQALRMNNQCPTEAELAKITEDHRLEDAVDPDAVPKVNFDQFCDVMRQHWRSRDQLLEDVSTAFATFDRGDTGVLGADELRVRLTSLGEVLDEAEVAELLKEANAVEGKVVHANLSKLLLDAYSRPSSNKKSGKKRGGGAATGRSAAASLKSSKK